MDLWNNASKTWDLIDSARKDMDWGEMYADSNAFHTARMKLKEAMERMEDQMAAFHKSLPRPVEGRSVVQSGDDVFRHKVNVPLSDLDVVVAKDAPQNLDGPANKR